MTLDLAIQLELVAFMGALLLCLAFLALRTGVRFLMHVYFRFMVLKSLRRQVETPDTFPWSILDGIEIRDPDSE